MGLKTMLRRWLEIDDTTTKQDTVKFIRAAEVEEKMPIGWSGGPGSLNPNGPPPSVLLKGEYVLPKEKAEKLEDAYAFLVRAATESKLTPRLASCHTKRNIDSPARIVDPSDTAALLGSIKS